MPNCSVMQPCCVAHPLAAIDNMSNDLSELEQCKQLLVTRMALERVQWAHDLQSLRTAAKPRNILSNAVRSVFPSGLGQAIFGASPRISGGRLSPSMFNRVFKVVMFVRRYPMLTTLAGGFLARRVVRRILIIGVVGSAVVYGMSVAKSNRGQLPHP